MEVQMTECLGRKKWVLEKQLERQEVLDAASVTRNKHSMNSLVSHNAVNVKQMNQGK